jgi:hypothetical protein
MGRPKLTTRETRIARRVTDRKKLLKRASVIGYTRPEGFGHFDDEVTVEKTVAVEKTVEVEKKAEKKVEKKETKKVAKKKEEKSE